jgi:autotransporter passenger strand-loop-strand repeat protein
VSVTVTSSGQVTSGLVLSSTGTQYQTQVVSSGGTADDTMIRSGGVLRALRGSLVSGTTVSNGGTAQLEGASISTTVLAGGMVTVGQPGETATGTVLSGGTEVVYEGIVSNTVILTGGTERLLQGTASGTVISAGGQQLVFTSGHASGTVISAGGSQFISATGSGVADIVLSGGSQTVSSGGFVISTTVSAGGSQFVSGTASATTISSGGVAYVFLNGFAVSTTILSGGAETISSGGVASNAVVSSGATLTVSSGGLLILSGAAAASAISALNFSAGSVDFITLAYTAGGTAMLDAASDILTVTEGANSATLQLAGDYTGYNFTLTDLVNETEVTALPCFCAGTQLLAEDGMVAVEDICVGDMMVTMRPDGPAMRRVVWTGKRSLDLRRHPDPDMVRPVRIRAGAFAPGVPERDLRLSPLHAVYHEGHLFEVASLINGVTIYQEQNGTHVTYYHIELDSHDILLAEGLEVESYLDTGSKIMFEDQSVLTLHPDFGTPHDAPFCVPMVREGEKLTALQALLTQRGTSRRMG